MGELHWCGLCRVDKGHAIKVSSEEQHDVRRLLDRCVAHGVVTQAGADALMAELGAGL